jgi:S-adenosylmethionine hydrolase
VNTFFTGIVTLLTDFGTADGYVGAMKGVLLSEIPEVQIVDISHEIAPYSYRQAAYSLLNYAFNFPSGTVHVVVVDPGVGSKRKGLILKTANHLFIGPDNGVFSHIYRSVSYQAFQIKEQEFGSEVSATFHGRDIFAPAAARLIKGEDIENFCDPVSDLYSFYEAYQKMAEGKLILKVLHVDHFGNLITNFTYGDWLALGQPETLCAKIADIQIERIKKTFSEVGSGQYALLWDSQDFLQIAENSGRASDSLAMGEDDSIEFIIK